MSERFYESPPWRFAVTTLDTETLTFLDKLASNREVVRSLNTPLVITGRVPSANPEVNILSDDGLPFLAEGARLLYALRNESMVGFNCRAAGIILEVRDRGNPSSAETTFVAHDSWQLAYRRPVVDSNGDLPTEAGLRYNAPGSDILVELLENSIATHGTLHLDIGTTSQWAGTIETTEVLEIVFQQGMSLGEAMDQLVETGTMDILLDPVYDPLNRPGIIGDLSVFVQAGSNQYGAIFAWDKPSRSLVTLDRETDGNERANRVQYYAGQGGPAVPLQSDTAAVAEFGEYWSQQFFPGIDEAAAVEAIAASQLRLRSRGLVSYLMSPAPERSPVPFVEYDIGDYVAIYGSDQMREETATMKRVHTIPLAIGNDQMEAPANIVVADDPTTSAT